MAKLRLYPHLRADPDAVTFQQWWYLAPEGRRELPAALSGWDYAAKLTIGLTGTFDPSLLLASTGLTTLAEMNLLAVAESRTTGQRWISRLPLASDAAGEGFDITLDIPPGEAATALHLSAHLVLSDDRPPAGRVASAKGARLLESETVTVALEGDGGRFPTDPIPFSQHHYGNAPWTLLATFDDLSDWFLATVRLLVNTEHAAGRAALDARTAPRIERLLRFDVIRLLVAAIAQRIDKPEVSDLEPGSVGAVANAMTTTFLGDGLASVVQLYRSDPIAFEMVLHDRLDPLTELFT